MRRAGASERSLQGYRTQGETGEERGDARRRSDATMSTIDAFGRRGESLRRWAGENEARAVAAAAYAAGLLVMLVLVVSAIIQGSDGAVPRTARDYYTVQKDDTLAAIARDIGMGERELRALNPGLDPLALQPGSKLRLDDSAPVVGRAERRRKPARVAPADETFSPKVESSPSPSASPAPAPAPPMPESPNEPGETHVVSAGDTLSSIAGRYGTTVEELLALNPGIDPYAIVDGQEIRVG